MIVHGGVVANDDPEDCEDRTRQKQGPHDLGDREERRMRHDRGDRFRTAARGRNVDERVDGQEQRGPDKQHESDA